MFRFIYLILYIIFSLLIISCGGTKKTSDSRVKTADSTDQNPAKARVENKAEWKGSEIIAESVTRLDSKLTLNEQIKEKVKAILTETFLAAGGALQKKYPVEAARMMAKEIIRNSKNPILEVLDDNQKVTFKQLLLN